MRETFFCFLKQTKLNTKMIFLIIILNGVFDGGCDGLSVLLGLASYAELFGKDLAELLVEEAIAGEIERQVTYEQELGDHNAVLVEARALAVRATSRAEHGLNHVEHENRKLTYEKEKHHGDEHYCDAYTARFVT
jgi:hypothetical protein